MKDTEARIEIHGLDKRLAKAEGKLERLNDNIVIRHCPKCNHDTVQTKVYSGWWNTTSGITISGNIRFSSIGGESDYKPDEYYRCLNCGVKIKCTSEKVCTLVDDNKKRGKKKAKVKDKAEVK